MNISQARPRNWTPHIILFSLVLHAIVLYYLAVAFKVVPPPQDIVRDRPPITVMHFPPPEPTIEEPERIEKKPIFEQRQTTPPPVETTVPPSPLPPTPVPQPGPATVLVGRPIPETPVIQTLPRYPPMAEARQIEGRVVLSITILPDGSVSDVRVVEARPRGYFEDAAVNAVKRWRYRASNVTRTNVIVHMDFELRDA